MLSADNVLLVCRLEFAGRGRVLCAGCCEWIDAVCAALR